MNKDSNYNSVDDWLAQASGRPESSDMGFTLNESKVKETLSGLAKVYPNLWFLHLMQLLFELGPQTQAWFCESNNFWEFRIKPPTPGFWDQLLSCDWNTVNPLGPRLDNKLARINMELEAEGFSSQIRVEEILSTVIQKVAKSAWRRHLNDHNLTWTAKYGCLNLGQLDQKPTAGGNGWFAPWKNSSELWETPYWCDFETVKLPENGRSSFSWSFVALGQSLGEMGPGLFFHPLEYQRGFASQVIFGHYPQELCEHISLQSEYPTLSTRVERVLGIFWGPLVRNPSQIRPVIKGVLGAPIFLEDFPCGILCYAEASHLKTDLSQLALVSDEAYQEWLRDVRSWIKEQAREYLPLYPKVRPYLWSQIKSRSRLEECISAVPPERRFVATRFLHKVFGEDRVREVRARELRRWLRT